jgi:methyl-accepting chemotaxis protein
VTAAGELGATATALRGMVEYLRGIERAGARIADGDLTVEVFPNSGRDALGNAFKRMVARLRRTLEEVVATAATVSESSEAVARTTDETDRAVAEVAQAMGEITAGAERQLHMVGSATRAAQEMATAVDVSAEAPARRPAPPGRRARWPATASTRSPASPPPWPPCASPRSRPPPPSPRSRASPNRSARSWSASRRSPSRRTCWR